MAEDLKLYLLPHLPRLVGVKNLGSALLQGGDSCVKTPARPQA